MSQALISIQKASKIFGTRPLFQDLTLVVAEGERLALIGPNGAGKSTLMRLIAGTEELDDGEIARRRGIRIGYVEQQPVFKSGLSVTEVLTQACQGLELEDYQKSALIQDLISRLEFPDQDAAVESLSGGWKKRLAIGAELIKNPDLLLLDEPTNHLDIEGILWLEEYLLSAKGALCFVSHDRYFIERLAKRVIEIDPRYPGGSFSCSGSYSDFLLGRQSFLEGLASTRQRLANRVRREVEWLRQGAKARTTKSKHRSEQAHKLVAELDRMDIGERSASVNFSASDRKTRELVQLIDVSKALNNKTLFRNLDFTISPGTRLGVVGSNGSGKTTFIKSIIGEIKPDSGQIIRANGLRCTFFDQERKQLDPNLTLKRALCADGDSVVVNGRQHHIIGWASKFLFRPEQLALPLSSLSGGEQARVLLARLVQQQADILVFDEPTNDLDIATLEVLEESFVSFAGAIVLVTHDRYFMDRVATAVLGLDGRGSATFFADYSQWEIARSQNTASRQNSNKSDYGTNPLSAENQNQLRHELHLLERHIEKEEKKLKTLRAKMEDPAISHDPHKLALSHQSVTTQEKAVAELLQKWEQISTELA